MKPLALRTRMAAWFAGLAALLVVAMTAAYYLETQEALLESLDIELHARAQDVAACRAAGQSVAEPPQSPRVELRGYEVWSPPGPSRVACSSSLAGLPGVLDSARLASLDPAGAPRFVGSVRLPATGMSRVYAEAFPAGRAGPAPCVVVVVEDLSEVEEEMGDVLTGFAFTLPAALALACAAAWFAAKRLTRPLRDIAAAASRVDSGGQDFSIPGSGAGDEIDRLAETLERTFARLRESYERQARFSADAAHEFRTPVAAVLAQAEVALRRERAPEEYRASLAQIADAARRMQRTLDALLLLARGDAGELVIERGTVDLADVARETVAAGVDRAAARAVRVRVAAASPAPVAGDARLLGLLVENLVANAVAHGRPHGEVDVAVESSADEVVLTVRDDGRGIPPEVLPRVFDRFFRGDESRSPAGGGAGLGLSLVRLVAQIHGGGVAIESEVGRGVRVVARFPRAASDRALAAAAR